MPTTAANFARARAALRFTDVPTFGNVYFVSSVTGVSGGGYTADAPALTIAAALLLCTASKGDRIYVAPDHVETIATAGGIALNVAGVEIIGLGVGSNRPTLTWSATDSTMTITANNVLLRNFRTKCSIDEVVSMISVTGAGVTLDTVDFIETASCQAIQWLLTTAAADQLTIKNCTHRQATAAGSAQKWIQLVGTDHTVIIDNVFHITANASTSSHLVSGTTAVVDALFARNTGTWLGATITGILSCVTGSTGVMRDNSFGSGTSVATTTAYVGDGMYFDNNKWADTMGTASGLLAPAVDTDT